MENQTKKIPKDYSSLWALLIIIGLLLLMGVIGGCNRQLTPEQQKAKVERKQAKAEAKFDKLKYWCDHDDDLVPVPPRWSAKNWPVIETIKPGAVHEAETVDVKQEAPTGGNIDCEEAFKRGVSSVHYDCPPNIVKTITKTVTRVDTFYQERTDKLDAVNKQHKVDLQQKNNEIGTIKKDLAKSEVKCKAETDRANGWRKWFWVAVGAGILLLLVVLAFITGKFR